MKKILVILICLCMLLSAVACKPTTPNETTPKAPEVQTPQKTYQELYADIVAQYTALLTAKKNGEELTAPNTEGMDADQAAIAQTVFHIVDGMDVKYVEKYGYGYKDCDGNGTPELILSPNLDVPLWRSSPFRVARRFCLPPT